MLTVENELLRGTAEFLKDGATEVNHIINLLSGREWVRCQIENSWNSWQKLSQDSPPGREESSEVLPNIMESDMLVTLQPTIKGQSRLFGFPLGVFSCCPSFYTVNGCKCGDRKLECGWKPNWAWTQLLRAMEASLITGNTVQWWFIVTLARISGTIARSKRRQERGEAANQRNKPRLLSPHDSGLLRHLCTSNRGGMGLCCPWQDITLKVVLSSSTHNRKV